MKPAAAASPALFWVALSLGAPALAEPRPCSALAVDTDPAVLDRWPDLPRRIDEMFAARDGLDTCARVRLRESRSAIAVEVTLADGRSTSRIVHRGEDVIPVLAGLLSLPPELAVAAEPEEAVAPEPVRETNVAATTRRPSKAQAPPTTTHAASAPTVADEAPIEPEERLGVELSLVTGARAGDGQTSVGLGALSFVDLWGWLAGFGGRADSYVVPEGEPRATLELAAFFGRRFRFENVALDVIAGPALALEGESTVETGPAGEHSEITEGPVPRLRLASHLHFSPRSALRTFVGIDGQLGPADAPGVHEPNQKRPLPTWMVGVALGATVGTR